MSEPSAGVAPRRRELPLEDLLAGLRERRTRFVARAVSRVENGGAGQRELVERIAPLTGRARVVGFTGPPGAGKSTLVDRFARLCRERDETVGVLAVDPSSPYTGGAILGDRIRMQSLYLDSGAYIRSMATRGAMGGLARATHDAIDVLDAAGFDWVLVETVGVGQDEVDIVRSVDTVVVITLPGLGDDIQAIKAGIMEIADVFVINKADRDGVHRTARDLESMLGLAEHHPDWPPPILKTIASLGEGVPKVLEEIERHRAWLHDSGRLEERREARLRLRVEAILKHRILQAADRQVGLTREVHRGMEEGSDPYRVADRLFEGVIDGGVIPGEEAS
ncbi:MAG: methylmalonyl Co-A mutase-associated GTPase MeaB [Acidobacteriota bacterium]